ncbi:MAG: hypothetical protein PHN80_13745 [Hespellia sp.]|nr:hypothetical protein [Hespellia sp.]
MDIYVLSSYSDSLNDAEIALDYETLYKKMKHSYEMTLKDITQDVSEQEMTYITDMRAVAVVHGDWVEWNITKLKLPAVISDRSSCKWGDLREEIIQIYQNADLCLGELLANICVTGLSLEDSLILISQLYKQIDGDSLIQIEGNCHLII